MCQKKAEYVSYRRVSSILFPCPFLNVDSSFNIKDRQLKLAVGVLGIMMEGMVSQIFLFRP